MNNHKEENCAAHTRSQAVDTVAAEQGATKDVDPTKALQQKLEFLKREEAAIRAELSRSDEAEKAAAQAAAAKKLVKVRVGVCGCRWVDVWVGAFAELTHFDGAEKAATQAATARELAKVPAGEGGIS